MHTALSRASDLESRLIVAMKHFGLAWNLPDRCVQCYRYLTERRVAVEVIRTEELFSRNDRAYFDALAAAVSHDGYTVPPARLMAASPGSMKDLPAHSTGEFRKAPLDGYTGAALEMYERWFLPVEEFFYGTGTWQSRRTGGSHRADSSASRRPAISRWRIPIRRA